MFEQVTEANFIQGEHDVLRFWNERGIFRKLREQQESAEKIWSFLDGPITANNPMGVHHAWGRTYKDAFGRFFAMTGHKLRYQNGFDCQGLWVEVEVEKEMQFGTKRQIEEHGIDQFVNECKKRVLRFAARQTEQSQRLGYWMEWDHPDELRKLAEHVGSEEPVEYTTANGTQVKDAAHRVVAKLGCPEWGGSYFTFSTNNNETIWAFLKKCFERGKIYQGHDVMPWSGRAGSAYSQMEIADGRKLTTHRSCFVRFPIVRDEDRGYASAAAKDSVVAADAHPQSSEYLLVWTTTPWTLTSNVAAAVNPDLDYVKLRAKRDDAVYYFAKDNLEFQRLSTEFKEGFGRPEWEWPEGVPKLKTLAQIFKEQGGFEIEGTLKGAEMVGWKYQGPFDDLDAQQQPGGYPEDQSANPNPKSAVECHQVIDGGRDSRGNAHVVAGEGTGIVHIAPGCGDIDHKIGAELGLVGIAPLSEDGKYRESFGSFTGREANSPQTAELVFEELKRKNLLVYVETYPHIYPFCWRTGDELVFRLVDEWFIDMDWRDEIKDVVKHITWLPEEMQGQERELEWLTIMRDWMISKKRFWGLALPIWVDEETGDFEVMGSLAELKERAVEGWDEFEGNTPHRPWIDKVKIENPKTGNRMSRVPDVGNPWLDAGIVPFSTLPHEATKDSSDNPQSAIRNPQWYPADFVTECFPGQFRNWFYSMLSLSTMMQHGKTEDLEQKRPFKTLLGHRLVMDEKGQPMHKSDGTAIWFEEAAEQLGVDTLRWMYLAQNPSTDLRFGLRHPENPVTLHTPDGDITETRERLPTCEVTSTPADATRRQVLIPLWNSYAFFVNYARLDGFDPQAEAVPVSERPEIDRWILSNLQALITSCREAFANYDSPAACKAVADFIDDLSNWYIRRNRGRFWAKQAEAEAQGADAVRNKLAAYQTLHHVLVTLTKLLAPCVPFLSERMYRNLVCGWDSDAPESVHLCAYPEADASLLDSELNQRAATAQLVVKLALKLREENSVRVRQPLAELRYSCASPEQQSAIGHLTDVIADELNVKTLTGCENLDDLVSYSYKPNLRTLGPKYGKLLGVIKKELPALPAETLDPLRRGESVSLTLGGNDIELAPDDVLVSTEQAADWVTVDDQGIQIALSTVLTKELVLEGMARDFVRHVQQLRKEANLEENDRITVTWAAEADEVGEALAAWDDYIREQTRADSVSKGEVSDTAKSVNVGEFPVRVEIERV